MRKSTETRLGNCLAELLVDAAPPSSHQGDSVRPALQSRAHKDLRWLTTQLNETVRNSKPQWNRRLTMSPKESSELQLTLLLGRRHDLVTLGDNRYPLRPPPSPIDDALVDSLFQAESDVSLPRWTELQLPHAQSKFRQMTIGSRPIQFHRPGTSRIGPRCRIAHPNSAAPLVLSG